MTARMAKRHALTRGAGFTLPRTRARLSRFAKSEAPRVLCWWVAAWLVLLNVVWVVIRDYADSAGFPLHGASFERAVFGGLPGLWLQQRALDVSPGASEWASAVVHISWFVVPVLAGILVSFKAPRRIGSFFGWWIALYYVGLIAFTFFPTEPPW